jgi:hypothetical protein
MIYLQSQVVWLRLSYSFINGVPFVCVAAILKPPALPGDIYLSYLYILVIAEA